MPDYNTVKRPPNYGDDDYVLRALYRLLGKHFSPKRNKSPSPYNNRPMNRGFGRAAGSKGPSAPKGSYAQQYRPSYSHGQGGSGFAVPKKPEPSYPRESRPFVQSLPQPRTEPDTEELLRRLEHKADDRLVEQVMAKLEAESKATEKAVETSTAEPQSDSAEPEPTKEESASETTQEAGTHEDAKTDTVAKPEPQPLDDPYELDLDDLEWLDEEMRGLVVEIHDLDADAEPPDLDLLESAGTDIAKDATVLEPESTTAPELSSSPLEPISEFVDPLKSLEPGIAELEEEVDEEAEPL
jgi:hypothetical protein